MVAKEFDEFNEKSNFLMNGCTILGLGPVLFWSFPMAGLDAQALLGWQTNKFHRSISLVIFAFVFTFDDIFSA